MHKFATKTFQAYKITPKNLRLYQCIFINGNTVNSGYSVTTKHAYIIPNFIGNSSSRLGVGGPTVEVA